MQFQTLNAEPDGDEVRLESLRGEDYLVAPVVLVREGVLNGGFLGYDEIKRSVPGWNGRPVTAPPADDSEAATLAPEGNVSGHPVETNGDGEPEFVSANQRPYIEDMHVGHLANVEADDEIRGLTGEAWLSADDATEVGESAIEAARRIAESEKLDVSTGYFHRPVRTQGRHEGTAYEVEQTDLMPDHLALLPNERGACSWADGCGTPRVNALLDADRSAAANSSFRERVLNVLGLGDEAGGESCGHGCIAANLSTGDIVEWSASGGTAYGRVREIRESEDAEPFSDEIAGDTTVNPPAARIQVYRPGEDEYEPTDTYVAHKTDTDTLSVRQSFPEANTTTNTMTDYDIETLAERSAFAVEALDEWDEDRLATLAETLDANDGTDGGGDGDGTGDGGGDGDGDPTGNADDDVQTEIEDLREEVEALREEQEQDKREALVETVAANTDYDRETVETLDTEALETLAEDLPDGQAATGNAGPHSQGNPVNYVAQGGATATPDEDETEGYTQSVGALRAMDEADEQEAD
jgi:hypothetical protein